MPIIPLAGYLLFLIFNPEDGVSKFLEIVSERLRDYTASLPEVTNFQLRTCFSSAHISICKFKSLNIVI
jgi:hypothetical protein